MNTQSLLGEAVAHHQAGRLTEAEQLYQRVLQIEPANPSALQLLGVLAHQGGRHEAAVDYIRRAIVGRPDAPHYHNNLGLALQKLGRYEEAIAAFNEAIRLKPEEPEPHNNLGNALRETNQFAPAIQAYTTAIRLAPQLHEARSNLGLALVNAGQPAEALPHLRHVIVLQPNYADAFSHLGYAWRALGEQEESVACYRRAVALDPKNSSYHDNLLLGLHYVPRLDADSLGAAHRVWRERHADPIQPVTRHVNDRDPDRPLRIGYVSGDFRDHVVARFLLPLFTHHDRRAFKVFGYFSGKVPDAATDLFRDCCEVWRPLAGLSDADAAALIQRDEIDILVDLAGHTAQNRLLIFARQPAPLQVAWLGYPDTTGLRTMQYRLTDALADPPGLTEHHYTEQLVRLPRTAWCYRPRSEIRETRKVDDDPTRPVVFGSLNNILKITDPMLAAWSQILAQVPNSRLLFKLSSQATNRRDRALQIMQAAGIAPERVWLHDQVSDHEHYVALFRHVDIGLDPFPYHGATTTCDLLSAGIPVISLIGDHHVSRVGLSLLTNAGVPELTAASEADYVRIAVDLAHDRPRLARYHATLSQRMRASPLMDEAGFAAAVEDAYRGMWRRWCAMPASQGSG